MAENIKKRILLDGSEVNDYDLLGKKLTYKRDKNILDQRYLMKHLENF